MTTALHTSSLTSRPLLARGKVRDNYAVGTDRILMVASDRISATSIETGNAPVLTTRRSRAIAASAPCAPSSLVANWATVWAAGGAAVGRLSDGGRTQRAVNVALAVVLAASVAFIWV